MSSSEGQLLDPNDAIDEVRLFMIYALTGGDVKRTAIASGVDEHRVESLAHDFQWKKKLGGRVGLSTEKGQEEERALNRVASFVTAERLSRVFDRLIGELDSDPEFAKAFCTQVDADTREVSFETKNLVDLAKGLQLCHDIRYRALQDKQAQAADLIGKATDVTGTALAVYRGLASRFDRNVSLDTTAEIVKAVSDVREQTVQEETAG
jgi:hypothetical protein